MRCKLLFVCLFAWANIAFSQTKEAYSRVKVLLDNQVHTIRDLAALGVATDHGEYKKNTFFITDFSSSELSAIKKAGFKVEIMISDVSKHYAGQNKKKLNAEARSTVSADCNPVAILGTPTHFALGSYGGYFTYTELLANLDSMQAVYPGLISARAAIDTFHSIEGRPIYWIRVSNNPTVDQPTKPQMLYTALHHAREPGTISSMVYFLWYILENYSTDPTIKSIVDNTELYFIPCVNPDGFLYNISTNPSGGGLWRKNRRDNNDGTYGIDLNRNYGFNWGYDNVGSSPTTSSETYRGPSAFSEPETQAVKWFATQHRFKLNLNYHTYGNDVIYPWGYIPSLQTVDSARYYNYAHFITANTLYRYGTSDQTVGYVTNGDSDDWMYGDTTAKPKVLGMTPETGLAEFGFYTPIANIIPDCKNNLRTNISAAKLLLPFSEVNVTDEKIVTAANGFVHYSFMRTGFPDTATFTVSLTSLDSRLSFTSPTHSHINPTVLNKITDSVAYSISSGTPNGQLLNYVVAVYNGLYYSYDTVSIYYGPHFTNVVPGNNSLADWTSVGWDTCNQYFVSAPASIATSTHCQNYPDASDFTLQLNQEIDLTHALQSYLYFYARWSIESSYDYVAAEATPVGSTSWQPLCGKYTKPGTPYQLHTQPIYDGQQPDWVLEEIDLSDYIGQKINLRFELVSDAAVNYPGFYLDNANIITINDSSHLAVLEVGANATLDVYPDPASIKVSLRVNGTYKGIPIPCSVYDGYGRCISSCIVTNGLSELDISQWPDGVYYIRSESVQLGGGVRRLVVRH